jgi:hypothetical protein
MSRDPGTVGYEGHPERCHEVVWCRLCCRVTTECRCAVSPKHIVWTICRPCMEKAAHGD